MRTMPPISFPVFEHSTLCEWHREYIDKYSIMMKCHSALFNLGSYVKNLASVPDAVGLVGLGDLLSFYLQKNSSALWSFPAWKASLIEVATERKINFSGLDHHTWAEVFTRQWRHVCSHMMLLRRDVVKRNRALKSLRIQESQDLQSLLNLFCDTNEEPAFEWPSSPECQDFHWPSSPECEIVEAPKDLVPLEISSSPEREPRWTPQRTPPPRSKAISPDSLLKRALEAPVVTDPKTGGVKRLCMKKPAAAISTESDQKPAAAASKKALSDTLSKESDLKPASVLVKRRMTHKKQGIQHHDQSIIGPPVIRLSLIHI